MKSFAAFMKKEWLEQLRTGRFFILGLFFVLLGIMNPAIAKLTPRLFEALAKSFAENGIYFTEITVDAMTSWAQFYKNVPMGLVVFILLESSIFTKEYSQNTLLLTLAKGFRRYKVVAAKGVMILLLWSFYYWICFGITYCYNDFSGIIPLPVTLGFPGYVIGCLGHG